MISRILADPQQIHVVHARTLEVVLLSLSVSRSET
jgi:hypothetical protein